MRQQSNMNWIVVASTSSKERDNKVAVRSDSCVTGVCVSFAQFRRKQKWTTETFLLSFRIQLTLCDITSELCDSAAPFDGDVKCVNWKYNFWYLQSVSNTLWSRFRSEVVLRSLRKMRNSNWSTRQVYLLLSSACAAIFCGKASRSCYSLCIQFFTFHSLHHETRGVYRASLPQLRWCRKIE